MISDGSDAGGKRSSRPYGSAILFRLNMARVGVPKRAITLGCLSHCRTARAHLLRTSHYNCRGSARIAFGTLGRRSATIAATLIPDRVI